ncbi:hypothetical protein BTJ08_06450 [Lactobacillus delbrueckii subsp. bulgaricus]|nr:hypothetical protein [Lactobacillus delbrueckii subsp. bulgaricus]MBT9071515.1 hypothetical protein [Lactobacillus delbrueckii subsp. bulgaricus]
MKYTITAATGHLGREVVKELSKLTDVKNIRLAVRSPQKAADLAEAGYEVIHSDYYDVPTGTDVLIYIPSITYNVGKQINSKILLKQ